MIYHIKPWMYPILWNVNLLIACLASYFQAAKEKNVDTDVIPFISDLGRKGVAAAIFSLFFSIYAFLGFVIMTLRFEQVGSVYMYAERRCLHVLNLVSYGFGLLACIGVCLLANFRELSNPNDLLRTHMAGTLIAFILGSVYFILQSIFSFFWTDLGGSNLCVNVFRAILSVVNFALLVALIVLLEKSMETGNPTTRQQAALIEWVFAFLMTFYALTFIPEFYKLKVKLVVTTNVIQDIPRRLVLRDSNEFNRVQDEQTENLVQIDSEEDDVIGEGYSSDDNLLL